MDDLMWKLTWWNINNIEYIEWFTEQWILQDRINELCDGKTAMRILIERDQ